MSEILEAVKSGDLEGIRRLAGADPGVLAEKAEDGTSMLLQALYNRQPDAAALLAELAGPLDIHEAAALGDAERVRALIEEDPGLSAAWSADGFTPLHLAAFFGRELVVDILIAAGAQVGLPSRQAMGVTPINSGAAAGSMGVVRRLLDAGADPNARMAEGYTPLMAAANVRNAQIVELLLAWGADPSATTDSGLTVRDIAAERGDPEVLGLL